MVLQGASMSILRCTDMPRVAYQCGLGYTVYNGLPVARFTTDEP